MQCNAAACSSFFPCWSIFRDVLLINVRHQLSCVSEGQEHLHVLALIHMRGMKILMQPLYIGQ